MYLNLGWNIKHHWKSNIEGENEEFGTPEEITAIGFDEKTNKFKGADGHLLGPSEALIAKKWTIDLVKMVKMS